MAGRRLVYISLWILSLVAISFYGGTVSYGFFWGLTMLPVVSGVYLLYVYMRFRIYQNVNVKAIVCGQALPYYFVLQNDDYVTYASVGVRLFSDFSDVEEMPDNREYQLLPGDKFRYDTRITCKYRGEYYIGVKEIILTDFLKLFRVKYKIPFPVKATVVPRLVKLEELKSIPEITAFMQRETLLQEIEPDAAVRDYVQGDSLKRIHWKATAREQKLKVRQMTGEEKQGIAIVCDTKRFSGDRKEYLPVENKILETLLALGYFFAAGNTQVKVVYRQKELRSGMVEGIAGFDNFYREVSEFHFEDQNDLGDVLKGGAAGSVLADCKAVFFITHAIDETLLREAMALSESGRIAVLYVVTDRDISEYIRQSSVRMKILAVPPEANLKEVL